MAPREFFTRIEDRLISGKGIIEVPQEDDWRWFRLWVKLIRPPSRNFENFKWNPSRSEYAKVTWIWDDWVWKEDVIRYEQQVFDYPVKEPAAFLAPYLVCSNQAQGNLLAAIAVAVGLPPPGPGDPLYVEPVKFELTRFQFSCRDESAFQLILEGLKEDVGCPGATPNPKRDLPPSNTLPPVPSGDNIEVSAPYSPPDDNGNTVPYVGDPIPPTSGNFPAGVACQNVQVRYRVRLVGTGPNAGFDIDQIRSTTLFGIVDDFDITPPVPFSSGTSFQIFAVAQGRVGQTGCGSSNTFVIESGILQNFTYEIFEVVEVILSP